MEIYTEIALGDEALEKDLESFHEELRTISFGDKLSAAQKISDSHSHEDQYKLILLYLEGEDQIRREIRRIYAWRHSDLKAKLLLEMLQVHDRHLLINILQLLAVLKETYVIPYLEEIFEPQDTDLCIQIVKTLDIIADPFGARIIKRCLGSKDDELTILSIGVLAKWPKTVKWQTFKPLLKHDAATVRCEAAYAIAIRKARQSYRPMLTAMLREKDKMSRYKLIRYCGMIPNRRMLRRLLKTMIGDKDQKARFIASHALDRLQGLLRPKDMFRLRRVRNTKIRAEVITRIGKFGTDNEKYKDYIRKVLQSSQDEQIVHACLQAIGYLAEHKDVDLLTKHLSKDPLSSYTSLMGLTRTWRTGDREDVQELLHHGIYRGYSTAIALTRTWRLSDKNDVLGTLDKQLSATQRQVILKYLIRKKGLGIEPLEMLNTVRELLDEDDNLNVRYLAFSMLEFAPCDESIAFLLEHLHASHSKFDVEAIEESIKRMSFNDPELVFDFMNEADMGSLKTMLNLLPDHMPENFYQRLCLLIARSFPSPKPGLTTERILDIFTSGVTATKSFLKAMSDDNWLLLLLEKLRKRASREFVESVDDQLTALLTLGGMRIRPALLRLIKEIEVPDIVPKLIQIAEMPGNEEIREITRNVIKRYVENGVL